MRFSLTRATVVAALLAVVSGARVPAVAQLGISQSDQRVLVLWPIPAANIRNNASDSLLAVQIGDLFRDRLDVKERFKMRVQTRAKICEILMGSGYHCPEFLDPDNAERLAGVVSPDAYVLGVITRNSKPTLHLHLVDLKRTGIAGWVTIVGDTNWKAEQFASAAVDSIDSALRGAEAAHDCYDRLDHNDVKGAREKAGDALKVYPNQPSAALCLQRYYETVHAPVDSIIFALTKATNGDSLFAKAWERLANAYLEKNDLPHALEARTHQLNATPRNSTLRFQVAAGWVDQKQYQKGVDILDVGLQENPLDIQMLSLKQRACVDGQLWKCALSALSALYDADTLARSDSVFYAKIFGAAQSINDTTAMLKWSAEAVKRLPNSLTMWRARAAALTTAGKADSAVFAYRKILQYDSTNVSVMLIVTKSEVDALTRDLDAGTVDSARLGQIDAALTKASTLAKDSVGLRGTIGQLYGIPAIKLASMANAKKLPASLYVPWLEKTLAYPVPRPIAERANFFLAIVYLNQAVAVDPLIQKLGHPAGPPRAPTAAEKTQACELVAQEEDAATKAKQAMTIGQPVMATAAAQVLGGANQFLTKNIPAYKKFFKCK